MAIAAMQLHSILGGGDGGGGLGGGGEGGGGLGGGGEGGGGLGGGGPKIRWGRINDRMTVPETLLIGLYNHIKYTN